MIKIYCDRCGGEIQGSKYAWLRHKTRYAVQRLIPSSMRNDLDDIDKYLCPNCEEKYIHWFMNSEPPKKEKQELKIPREDEATSDMRDYCEQYEPTYNPEDGSM